MSNKYKKGPKQVKDDKSRVIGIKIDDKVENLGPLVEVLKGMSKENAAALSQLSGRDRIKAFFTLIRR